MRTDVKVAAISFAVVLGACNTRQEQSTGLSEDLKRDLAAASAPGDLATAPRAFERTRFVSKAEMTRATTPSPRLVATKRKTPKAVRAEAVKKPAPDVVADETVKSDVAMAPAPAPVATPNATEEKPIEIVQLPTADQAPATAPSNTGRGDEGRGEGNGGIGDHGRGGGLGGLLGGIIGAVVIRGGHGGVDHCDPRTDGRRRAGTIGGGMMDRPNFPLPLPTGRTTFPTRLYTRL
jgi:hypothetical protein